jgi:OmpA-OmpF porin, OOP family
MQHTHNKINSSTQFLKPTRIALAISLAAMVASPMLLAQEGNKYNLTSNWYGGLNIGQTHESINDGAIANREIGGGLTSITDDDRDNGYKLFAGYQLNDNFALEAGYFDLGQFGSRAIKDQVGALKTRTKTKGFNVDLVGSLPMTEKLSAFARAGVHYSEAKDRFQGSDNVVVTDRHRRERDVDMKWGGGLQYDFTQKFAMRLEAERYAINDVIGNNGKISMYSLGAIYRFGEQNAAPAQAMAAAPVTQRSAKLTEEYCSMLDIQFEINNDEIQREDLERLAVVGTFLKKYPDTKAVVEGHTDNIGTPEANLKLSRDRAESVMSYLVREQRVANHRISAVGYGDTRPIADNVTEDGKRANRRINTVIACVNDIEGLSPAAARVTMAMLVEFDTNSAQVKPEYHNELAKVAKFLQENKTVTATVEGHTANVKTTPALAQDISLQRAQHVVDYLVTQHGIARSRLTAEGFGTTRRYSYDTSTAGQQDNRRVNVIFAYPKK